VKRVHLDHNATTPLRAEVRERWLEVLDSGVANASSLHTSGRAARDVVDRARAEVADALGADEDEITFTSGGTEANNLAIAGTLRAAGPDATVAVGANEHSSVLEAARALAPTTLLPVDGEGRIVLDALERALAAERPPALVCIMAANNEVGSLAPLDALGRLVGGRAALHVDAVQALGRLPVRPREWRADTATFSAHKVGGPLGVGVLWHRRGRALVPSAHGGGQEGGLRPGTENAPAIAAAALAIRLAVREQAAYSARCAELARELWNELRAALPAARLLGPPIDSTERLANTLSVLLPDVDGKVIVTRLDLEGLEVGAGSACASGSLEPSHVLLAMGLDENDARSALRISLGRDTTRDDCHACVDTLRKLLDSAHASRAFTDRR